MSNRVIRHTFQLAKNYSQDVNVTYWRLYVIFQLRTVAHLRYIELLFPRQWSIAESQLRPTGMARSHLSLRHPKVMVPDRHMDTSRPVVSEPHKQNAYRDGSSTITSNPVAS